MTTIASEYLIAFSAGFAPPRVKAHQAKCPPWYILLYNFSVYFSFKIHEIW